MFDRILAPVDGSSQSQETTEVASYLAQRFGAPLVLARLEGALASPAQALADNHELEQQVTNLRHRGLRVHATIQFGRSEKAIAELARTERAQLIVVAAHQRSRLDAILHPHSRARTLAQASAPLLVWPGRPHAIDDFLRIAGSLVLVALDGSEVAERALPFAVAFAREYRRSLVLVRVVPPPPAAGFGGSTSDIEHAFQAREEHDTHAYLCAVRHRLGREYPDLHVQSMILNGHPWQELLRCAQTHDGALMVIGTHGHGALQRMVLGSVAARLARECPLPLLIVPPAASMSDADVARVVPNTTAGVVAGDGRRAQ